MSDPLIGKQLGDYIIQSLLGRGGMARVYKGYDDRLQRYAAVKVINSDFSAADQAEYTERFRREARAIARLQHPNIVGVYQFGEYESNHYMAMVFLDGKDLRQILKEYADTGDVMPLSEILNIVHGIGSALDYAHSRGVIHRDIKPSNIMINTEGRAILTDFGLALSTAEGTLGDTFGSAHYIAPEQAVSSAKAVPQSDLYSLGICLYEMLTGKVPFDDPSAMSVALKHLNDPPPPPRLYNPQISPAIEQVIFKILDKDPVQRYGSGAQLALALEEAITADTSDQAATPSGASADLSTVRLDTREIASRLSAEKLQEISGTDKPKQTAKPKRTKTKARVETPPPVKTPGEDAVPTSVFSVEEIKAAAQSPAEPVLSSGGDSTGVKPPLIPPPTDPGEPGRPVATFGGANVVWDTNEKRPDRSVAAKKPRRGAALLVLLVILLGAGGIALASGVFGRQGGPTPTIGASPTVAATPATQLPTTSTSATLAVALNSSAVATKSATQASTATSTSTATTAATATDPATASPTNTAIQLVTSTATPGATATGEATSATAGVTAPVGPTIDSATADVSLVYDETQLLLINVTDHPINVATLNFVQRGPEELRFDTSLWWQTDVSITPLALPSQFCFQVARNDRVLPELLQRCRRATWARVSGSRWFWLSDNPAVTTFDVLAGDRVIATCSISAGHCEFKLE